METSKVLNSNTWVCYGLFMIRTWQYDVVVEHIPLNDLF